MESSEQSFSPGQQKIDQYAKRIRNGEDPVKVMQGLGGIFRDGIEKRLLELENQPEPEIFIEKVPDQAQVLQKQQKQERLVQEQKKIEELRKQLGVVESKNEDRKKEQKIISFEDEKKILELIQDNQLYDLENLSKIISFDNEYIKKVFETGLINNVKNENIKIIFTSSQVENKEHAGAWFDSMTNTVVIQKNALLLGYEKSLTNQKRGNDKYENLITSSFGEYLQSTITHELIHSVTAVITNMDKVTQDGKNKFLNESQLKSITEIKRILKDIQGFKLEEYGSENIDEFLAEIANKNFIEKLSKISDSQNISKTYKDVLFEQFQILIDNPIKNPYATEDNQKKLVEKLKNLSNKKEVSFSDIWRNDLNFRKFYEQRALWQVRNYNPEWLKRDGYDSQKISPDGYFMKLDGTEADEMPSQLLNESNLGGISYEKFKKHVLEDYLGSSGKKGIV